jgi:hypothetical protein
MAGRQEGVEPLDRADDLSSLSGEVEAVARGDRSMQQCRWDPSAPLATDLVHSYRWRVSAVARLSAPTSDKLIQGASA